jgi:MFS family permease
VANLVSAALVLPLVAVRSGGTVWLAFGSIFLLGCVAQVLATAENALLPALVPAGEEVRGNALNALNNNLARLGGPALGGVLTAYAGLGAVVVADAASFAIAAVLIVLVRGRYRAEPAEPVPGHEPAPGELARVWHDLVGGFATIRANDRLMVIFRYLAIISVGEGVMSVMIVVFTERTLGGGARELGWIVSAQAVGGVVGGLLGGWAGHRIPTRWLVGGGTVLMGVGDLAIFNYPRWYPELWPALALMAAVGVPAALLMAGVMSVLQTAVEDRWRGRVFGTALTVMAALSLVGTLLAATLGDRLGPVLLLNVQGLGLVAGGLYVITALRNERQPARPAQPVTGVTSATERTPSATGRTG